VEVRWWLPDAFGRLVRLLPYKLRLYGKGARGVIVSLTVYPEGTIDMVPSDLCCHDHPCPHHHGDEAA